MDWKKITKRLLFPHPVFLWLFVPLALVLLIYSAIFYESTDVISIVSYVCSFCALVLVCLRIPDIVRFVRRFRQENKYAVRYASDVQLRINLSLYGAFLFNAVYAFFQLALGFKHHSAWFYSMAGYYFLLGLMRLMLVRYTRRHAPGQRLKTEWKKYRLCGAMLLLMTLVLTVFILYFIFRIRQFQHHEITTISMAAYTFSALTVAIVNAFLYKKYGSPVYSAAKAISLVSAVVSVLTLENAMLTAFGQDNSELFRQIMLGATGAAVICAVQGIAIYMIRNAGKNLKAIHNL
ncbi:MAG: hypothetical protein IJB99_00580 [Clostridia bacterium]|nr:hypothetical protein [Clostridia bacterium]